MTLSAIKLIPIANVAIAAAGKIVDHQVSMKIPE
jgi:hypothetical protein